MKYPVLALLVMCLFANIVAAQGTITITSPVARIGLPWRACVEGRVSKNVRAVTPVIRALENSTVYVQAPIQPNSDGTFRGMLYLAKNSPEFNGVPLQLRVLAEPMERLTEGMMLPDWPEAAVYSDIVDIFRRDGAPSGCGQAASSAASNVSLPSSLACTWPSLRDAIFALWILALLAFVSAQFRARRAQAVIGFVKHTCRCVKGWTAALVKGCGVSIARLFRHQVNWLKKLIPSAWRTRGDVSSRGFMQALATCPLMTVLFWMALIADITGSLIALELVYGASSLGGLSDILPDFKEGPAPAFWAVAPMINTWTKPLGPMAVGISAIQAAFGWVLLFGLGNAVQVKMKELYATRTFPFVCYAFLNTAVAILAAFRAREMSPESVPGWIPAIITGLIVAIVPWIQAYALHYLLDTFTSTAAAVVAGISVAALLTGTALVLVGWIVVLGGLCVAVLVLLVAVFLSSAAMLVWLNVALMVKDAVDVIRTYFRKPAAAPVRHGLSPATASIIVLFVVLAFSLITVELAAAPKQDSHDPAQPFQAWVLCIDVSSSVSPEQFAQMKRVYKHLLETSVQGNDLVWLIPMKGEASSAKLYEIPPGHRLRSDPPDADARRDRAKAALIAAIEQMKQVAVNTDLSDPIDLALNLLRQQPRASRRSLLAAGDFVQDLEFGKATVQPPAPAAGVTARGVKINLLVAYPTHSYLNKLHITQAGLLQAVKTEWAGYFERLGSAGTAVNLVDAIPVGHER